MRAKARRLSALALQVQAQENASAPELPILWLVDAPEEHGPEWVERNAETQRLLAEVEAGRARLARPVGLIHIVRVERED